MVFLNRKNSQADQIVRAACLVLRVVIGLLPMQKEVGICCYLLHRLFGTQCPLVEAICYQVINKITKDFS